MSLEDSATSFGSPGPRLLLLLTISVSHLKNHWDYNHTIPSCGSWSLQMHMIKRGFVGFIGGGYSFSGNQIL